ncbi:AAA domain-containing protein [Termitidicoccus mucosus]
MILETMLQRLNASLAHGPGLNARPHNSRQRIDFTELDAFQGTASASALGLLFGPPTRSVEFPAKTPAFTPPPYPEKEWSDEQKAAARAAERQRRVLAKLREIATDATDYYNDHGENALFLGFPLIAIPAANGGARRGFQTKNLLAPVLLAPVNLRVRQGGRTGVTIETAGDGSDLIIPNPALLAWIEQQTGEDTDTLFADDTGENPWQEITDVLALVTRATGLPFSRDAFTAATPLQPVPRADALPDCTSLVPSAVLGLFPLTNPGLLRDTKWMIENERALENPVRAFLSPLALNEPAPHDLPAAREWNHTASHHRDIQAATPPPLPDSPAALSDAAPFLITHADPCQTEAVAHARRSTALVIHGPPGTGKSQTIANIIGDHLARGERVLFVCDKRTALDVVKYRLDGMGLGELCGVIHDPSHDRRQLYLGLRDRLESLPEPFAPRNPATELRRVEQRLASLRDELRSAFDRLHGVMPETDSFHNLTGQWLSLRALSGTVIPEIDGLTSSMLDTHRADAEEVLRRAAAARWHESPYHGRLGIGINAWLAREPVATKTTLENLHRLALAVENFDATDAILPALTPDIALADQSAARRHLADVLEKLLRRIAATSDAAYLATLTFAGSTIEPLVKRHAGLAPAAALLDTPPDRELVLALGSGLPSLGETNLRLAALDAWSAFAGSLKRFLAFSAKKAARAALAPLGLALDSPDALPRARLLYQGLRARWLWSDFLAQVRGNPLASLAPDAELVTLRDGLPEVFAIHTTLQSPCLPSFTARIQVLLAATSSAGTAPQSLRASAALADALAALHRAMEESGLFTPDSIASDLRVWIGNECQPAAHTAALLDFAPTLDDAVRLVDRLRTLPAPLARSLDAAIAQSLDWSVAEPALRATALARAIRQRLREDETLARIDTQRVEAAFSELAERTAEKQALVREHVVHRWRELWRARLLAATGTRLNTLGASIRQRLFVRGQRALKLRQMIAAGADTPGGDPLFDLCPVWMASPSTVAQIFPRTPLFDMIVFDEASQCRLEEALPVLLRGCRVVIAGDPKQLPPTRFFEQSLAESDNTAAETAGEVFEQQQSETEDLLSAALNLEVQEAFLDVHYRSRNEALIGFSNDAFYSSRLQPIPGHPRNKAVRVPIQLTHVNGLYHERGNPNEARTAAGLVAELLASDEPPSIGIACFNINQRDLILDALDEKAAAEPEFAARLEIARKRRGRDSFEGLFVKNLENVQGDERDHMIISTTFGVDKEGKFRRNFGALSRLGGERRLNVLVTRARSAIHILTSIPRAEYLAAPEPGARLTGRHQLYAYLRYAERLGELYQQWHDHLETARSDAAPVCETNETGASSPVAESLARVLLARHQIGSTTYWGNDGFCIDAALTHPEMPEDVTLGVLVDFNRYNKTPDPIAWELFRATILRSQGWHLHRLWTPALFRDPETQLEKIRTLHHARACAGS